MPEWKDEWSGKFQAEAEWIKYSRGTGDCICKSVTGETMDSERRTGIFPAGEDSSEIIFSENFGCIFHVTRELPHN
jgi:hypothetical protein